MSDPLTNTMLASGEVGFTLPGIQGTLWLVEDEAAAMDLARAGDGYPSRGRIWTLDEFNTAQAHHPTPAEFVALARTKLDMDGDVVGVRESPVPTPPAERSLFSEPLMPEVPSCPCPRAVVRHLVIVTHSEWCRLGPNYVARRDRDLKTASIDRSHAEGREAPPAYPDPPRASNVAWEPDPATEPAENEPPDLFA